MTKGSKVKPSLITQGAEKSSLIMQDQNLCFVFSESVFSDPKLDAKGKRHEANKSSSNKGESKESGGFYLKQRKSIKPRRVK